MITIIVLHIATSIAGMTPFHFAVLAFASWRLAVLVAMEDGPWRIFSRLRLWAAWVGGINDGGFGQLVSCVYCLSVWFGFLAAVAYIVSPLLTLAACLPLAVSGGAIFLQQLTFDAARRDQI